MPVSFSHISGAEPSTVTFEVATVQITRNSSAMQQEILSLGDPVTDVAVARVVAATPDSTHHGLVTRSIWSSTDADQPVYARVRNSTAGDLLASVSPIAGSTWATRPIQTSQADLRVTAYQSTAADLNVTVAGYSTIVSVSTGSVRVHQSTAADLVATAWQADGLGNAILGSTKASATSTGRGLVVRQAQVDSTYATGTVGATSTGDVTLMSSVAGQSIYVYGWWFEITSSGAGNLRLMSGSTTPLWTFAPMNLNPWPSIAVTPPQYLWKTAAGAPLILTKGGSSVFALVYNVMMWQE